MTRPAPTIALSIAPARPDDAATVAQLLRALGAHEGEDVSHVVEAAILRDVCGPGRAVEALIARRDGQAAGLAMWHPAYDTAHAARGAFLTDLFVAPPARRAGVGRALLAAVARDSAARGGAFLWLTALRGNAGARAFYRAVCGGEDEDLVAYAAAGARFAALARLA